jgi:hypothetical protein
MRKKLERNQLSEREREGERERERDTIEPVLCRLEMKCNSVWIDFVQLGAEVLNFAIYWVHERRCGLYFTK